MRRIGLYYPYIHFRDETWLKAAALYWPKIARIVPAGYQVRDSALTRALADGLNFLIDVQPDPTAAATVSSLFQQVLAEHADGLRARYLTLPGSLPWVSDHDPDRVLHPLLAAERLYPPALLGMREGWDNEEAAAAGPVDPFPQLALTGILRDEVEPALEYLLIEADLAFMAGRETGSPTGWLAVHPQLAWVYKCVLTQQIARQNRLQPTTDQVATQSADQEWTADQVAHALLSRLGKPAEQRSQELRERIAFLALRVAVPANLSDVPAKKIVRLRERYGADFDAFGDLVASTVAGLADALIEIKDSNVLDAYLHQEIERKFERPLEELRKAMRGLRMNTAFGALNVKFELPAAMAAAGGGLAAGQPILAGAGAVAFGLLGVLRTARHERAQKLTPSPESYLLHVGKLAPKSLLSQVAEVSHRVARRELS